MTKQENKVKYDGGSLIVSVFETLLLCTPWSGPKEFMIHCDCVSSFYNVQWILDVELVGSERVYDPL